MKNEEFAGFRISILGRSLALAAIVVITAAIFGRRYFSIGYAVGFLISTSSFSNMYDNIRKIADKQVKRVKLYLAMRFIAMYAVLALALIASAAKDKFMFIGVVCGFLSIKAVLFIDGCKRNS